VDMPPLEVDRTPLASMYVSPRYSPNTTIPISWTRGTSKPRCARQIRVCPSGNGAVSGSTESVGTRNGMPQLFVTPPQWHGQIGSHWQASGSP